MAFVLHDPKWEFPLDLWGSIDAAGPPRQCASKTADIIAVISAHMARATVETCEKVNHSLRRFSQLCVISGYDPGANGHRPAILACLIRQHLYRLATVNVSWNLLCLPGVTRNCAPHVLKGGATLCFESAPAYTTCTR